jgi:cbb3-type cytochrome oxidase subunit 1
MDWFVRNFIRSSLVWLGCGVLLGLWMVLSPFQALVYRPAHMHANLLGFVSMMIFGVAYHVIPRFTGSPLWSRRLAGLHLWAANIGLALMVAGWMTRPTWRTAGFVALAAGGFLSAAGAFLFITNIWRTLGPGRATLAGAKPTPRPELVRIGHANER